MRNLKNYTRGILSALVVFHISNKSFAAGINTNNSEGLSNTTVFYILLFLAIILISGIFFLANSIKDLMKSDFYKSKIYEQEKNKRDSNKNVITTILLLIGVPLASFSQAANSAAQNSDIPLSWVWGMVIINLILLGVVVYVRNLFFQILRTVKKKKIEVKENIATEGKEISKITQLLTDAVPLDREHEIIMDHEYDGIHELDNNMPPWWLWSFYASIVFAVIYIFNYHIFKTGDLQIAEYDKKIALGKDEVSNYLKTLKLNVDESNVVYLTNESDISKGKGLFTKKCVACHGIKAEGVIGPNLTDDNWIHGGSMSDIFKIIKYGNPSKGMQSWKDELNPVEMQQVTSYIKSIKGTAIGIGKEPQGELYKEDIISDTISKETTLVDTSGVSTIEL